MLRRVLGVVVVFGLMAGLALADDITGKVKKVDTEKNTITVDLPTGDQKTFEVSKDADIYSVGKGKKNKPGPKEGIEGGLKGVKEDSSVTMGTIKKGDREIVISIKVEPGKKK
jgi:hypothetical protein